MGRLHRKLSQEDCKAYCLKGEDCPAEQDCEDVTACISECSSAGNRSNSSPGNHSNSSPGNHSNSSPGNHSKLPTYLIIIFSVVAAAFFVFCCYAIYVKFFSSRNRSRRRLLSSSPLQQQQQQEAQEDTTRDEFLDEEHGPLMDHPIWYIRTPGLHQSIIKAITVCKYKRGEGLVEGTECSVCLSEFQEDESLRLLPKCNHAFHLPCIDTWLRSHTNCPMCRAPIVTNPAATRIPSMEPNVVDSSSLEGATQMGSLENSVGGDGDGGAGAGAELRNGSVEEERVEVEGGGRRVCENEGSAAEVANMQPRRSLSLDSSSAAKISAALATVVSSVQESHGNSKRQIGEAPNELVVSKRFVAARGTSSSSSSSSRTRNLPIAPGSMKRSRSFNGKHLMSWYSRSSQKKPSAPVRSF